MAYDSKNLSVLAYANGFTLWHYATTDAAADVDTAGYFNDASDMMRVSDMILANADTDGTPVSGVYLVNANAGGVVDVADITAVGGPGAGAKTYLGVTIVDISTADQVYVPAPVAGTVTKVQSVIDAAISGADATLTTKIGGTAITGGALTVANSGSAAGDVDTATPTGANTVAVGDALEVETDGASTGTAKATVLFEITPTADSD